MLRKHKYEFRCNINLYDKFTIPLYVCKHCLNSIGVDEEYLKELPLRMSKCGSEQAKKISYKEYFCNKINCFEKLI